MKSMRWIIPFVMGLFFLVSMSATILSPGILTGAENAVETLTGAPFSQIARIESRCCQLHLLSNYDLCDSSARASGPSS